MSTDYFRHFPVLRGRETVGPLLPIIEGKGYIAGSYAAFMVCPYPTPILPNDIDIFATTILNGERLADYFFGAEGFLYHGANEVAYSFRATLPGQMNIQVVNPHPDWKVFPDDIIGSFDLDISRAVLISADIAIADQNVGWLNGKVLRINSPVRTLKRIAKYMARGVVFEDHELLKVFCAWDQMSAERKRDALANAVLLPSGDDSSEGWAFDYDEYFDAE